MLFQWDMSQRSRQARSKILARRESRQHHSRLRQSIFEGAAKEVTILDEIIVKHAENWRFERLAAIDRAILRLAMHELRSSDTPPKVVLTKQSTWPKSFPEKIPALS